MRAGEAHVAGQHELVTAWLRLLRNLRQKRNRRVQGSAQGLYMIVSDIEAARKELLARAVAVSEVLHGDGALEISFENQPPVAVIMRAVEVREKVSAENIIVE